MLSNYYKRDIDGFTMVELIAVMAILSILTTLTVKKVVVIADTTEQNALVQGVVELNVREKMAWIRIKFDYRGYQGDESVWEEIDLILGEQYFWLTAPEKSGGTLSFGSQSVTLNRNASCNDRPGLWYIF